MKITASYLSSLLSILSALTVHYIQTTTAWTQPKPFRHPNHDLHSLTNNQNKYTRSKFLTTSLTTILTITTTASSKASAATSSPSQLKTDKENLIKGYNRLNYLLTNWEKETTICGRTDNPYIGCERTPEKVMDYLGFKSMNDPLFRIDKTLSRLQELVVGNSDLEIEFMEAMDLVNQAVEDGNGIAFVSSWGEANPGGGKDRIDLFIERSRNYVKVTRDGLGTIIKILDLKVD